jgi:hypothetical protein
VKELELCTPVIDGDDENPPGYGEPELTLRVAVVYEEGVSAR